MRLFLAVLVLTVSASVHAQEPQKERNEPKAGERAKAAWEWSLEERIAKRLDAQQIRERAAAYEQNLDRPQWMQVQGAEPMSYIVEGRRDPELLMPLELFGSILGGVDPTDAPGYDPDVPGNTREHYRRDIAKFGFQEELFWKTLEEVSAELLRYETESVALQLQMRTLSPPERRKLEARVEELHYKQCAARAAALRTARMKFGAEAFDRFLYGAVAPRVSIFSSEPENADHMRSLDGGCR